MFKYWNPNQTKKTSNFVPHKAILKITKPHKKSFLLFYILFGYVIAQICWWIFQIILLSRQLDGSGDMVQAKVRMLAGEFAVFFAIICGGMFYITRVFKRELKLSQNKKNFSLSITHELKTPITTTKLLVETLQNHQLPEEKVNEIYIKITNEQERLHELIDKVLLSERIDSKEFKLSLKKVNVSNFISSEIERLPTFQRVELKLKPDLLVLIDEFYFKSVIANLLENASKYSPNDSIINVDVSREGDNCLISIKDQGVGIPDDEKQKVFEVYYRLENEEIRNTVGTGLGLYLVKKIVLLHKASIKIKDNQNGVGSNFEVSIPLFK